MNKVAYLITRIAIGVSLLRHGLIRLPKLSAFSHRMLGTFKTSMIPNTLILPFSFLLPFAEFGTGLFILLGLFYRQAIITGAVTMILLILGTCLIEH